LIIKGLEAEGDKTREAARDFLEKEFGVKSGVKKIQAAGKTGRNLVIVEMDSWKLKEKVNEREKGVRRQEDIYRSRHDA